jgi:uncharacterized protein
MQELPMGELCRAAGAGDVQKVKSLLAAGANPNGAEREILPLDAAAEAGHVEVVKVLLAAGADPKRKDFMGYSPAPTTPAMAEMMFAAGADVRFANPRGETGIHLAARAGKWDMVKYWLGKGLKIDERDAGGYTALHLAAYRGEAHAVSQLLALGAKPNIAASSGWTPLKSAEAESHVEVVKLLRAAGAK